MEGSCGWTYDEAACGTGIEVRIIIAAATDASRLVGQFLRAVVKKVEGISTPRQRKLPLTG